MMLPFDTKCISVAIQLDDAAIQEFKSSVLDLPPALRRCRGGLVRINRRRSSPKNRRSEFRKARSWDDLDEPSSPIGTSTGKKFSVTTVNDFRPIRPRRSSVTMMGAYDQCEPIPMAPWSPVRGYQADFGGDAVPVKPRRSSLPVELHAGGRVVLFDEDEHDSNGQRDNYLTCRQPCRVNRASSGDEQKDACPVMPRRSSLAGLDVARKSMFCSATA